MQIIKGKQYNEVEIGRFILLVPVGGKHGEQLCYGELKDAVLKLKELGEIAQEENKKRYQEAREKYIATRKCIVEINVQLGSLPKTDDDIETLEARRLLLEEKRELENELYNFSVTVDQLYDKEFIPERKANPQPEPVKISSDNNDYTQTDGYKVRELRKKLGETQVQFGKRFNVSDASVSFWENNLQIPPKEVLEYQPTVNK